MRKACFALFLWAAIQLQSLAVTYVYTVSPPATNTPGGTTLNAATYGAGKFAAVGNGATVMSSTLGTSLWAPGTVPGAANLNAITYSSSRGLFVAGDSGGNIFTNGGSAWQKSGSAFGDSVAGLAYSPGANQLVAVAGGSYNVAYSPDATTWTPAVGHGTIFDQYRAVTAFGTSRFAACGLSGLVNISTNGGAAWRGSVNITAADLLGIAWGGNKLVAVGTSGTIASSADGITWSLITYGTTRLNAVTYAGDQFIAVGDGGLVITSPNGVNWTTQASHTTSGLLGAAFAPSGSLQNITVLVGSNRTAVVGGILPTVTSVTGNRTVCNADGPPSIQATLDGSAGPWNVSWASNGMTIVTNFNAGTPSSVNVSSANLGLTPVTSTYTVSRLIDVKTLFAATNLGGSASITVNPTPFVRRPDDQTVCNGFLTAAVINTGNATSYTWVNDNPTIGLPDAGTGDIPQFTGVNTNANLSTNAHITITPHYSNNGLDCTGVSETFTITVNPRPTATLVSADTTFCDTNPVYTVAARLTGLGPWTVTWWDGVQTRTNGPAGSSVIATRDAYPVSLVANSNAPTLYQYWVAAVATDNGCGSTALGDLSVTNTVTINPRPTATLVSVDATFCDTNPVYTVAARLTGLGPWTVTWWDGVQTRADGPAGSSVIATRDAYPVGLVANSNAPSLYQYWVAAVSTGNGCGSTVPGDVSGTNTVTINPRPTATLVSADATFCDTNPVYTVAARLTGLGPWTVTWWDGAQTRTNGPAGSSVIATYAAHPVGLAANSNAPSLYQYWVAAVATDNGCGSTVLGDLSGTNTVTINPRPTATLVSADATFCDTNPVYTVAARLTGLGPWTVTWWDSTQTTTNAPSGNSAVATRTVHPVGASANSNAPTIFHYWVQAVATTNGCASTTPADLVGTNTVTINPRPTATLVSADETLCDTNPVYTVAARLTGLGPWTVTWWDGVQTRTNGPAGSSVIATHAAHPVALVANSNAPSFYQYWVAAVATDNGCGSTVLGDVSGTNTVTINPRPTATLVSADATFCDTNPVYTVAARLTGLGPWTVTWWDGVQTRTNGPAGSSVIATRTAHPVAFVANSNAPSFYQYWVAAVATDNGCGSTVLGDLRGTNTVTIYPRPTATLVSADTTFCDTNPVYTVAARLTGLGPWTVTWWDLTQTTTNAATGNSAIATRTVYPVGAAANSNAPTIFHYWVQAVATTNGCASTSPGDVSGTNVVTINPRPTATLVSANFTTCDTNPTYTVAARLTGLGPWTVTWWDSTQTTTNAPPGTGAIAARSLVPVSTNANIPSMYQYFVSSVSTANGCGSTGPGDVTGTNLVTVNPNLVVTNWPASQAACPGDRVTFIVSATGLNLAYQWQHEATNLSGQTAASLVLTNVGTKDTGYYRVVVSSTACGGPITTTNAMLTLRQQIVIFSDPTNETACVGGTATFSIAAAGPDLRYQWYLLSGNVTNLLSGQTNSTLTVMNVAPTNAGTYSVVVSSSCGLPVTRSAALAVNLLPTAQVVPGNSTICPGAPTPISACLGGTPPFTVVWSDGVTNEGVFPDGCIFTRMVAPSDTTTYTITALRDNNNCWATGAQLSGQAQVTTYPRLRAVVSGTNTICSGPSTVYATFSGASPWYVVWASNGVPQPVQTYFSSSQALTNHPMVTTLYTVLVLSNNTCTALTNDLTGGALVTIAQPAAPVFQGDQTNHCAGTPNPPLTVSVPANATVDWYDQPTNGIRLAAGTPTITPITNNLGTHVYYAEARDIATGCTSSSRRSVRLVLEDCHQALAIGVSNRLIRLQWQGALALQAANGPLIPSLPLVWTTVTNGVAGLNVYSFSPSGQEQFFRLVMLPVVVNTRTISISALKPKLVLEWMGDRVLQSTPALTNPATAIIWTNVLPGAWGAPNRWTNGSSAPQLFFRLDPDAGTTAPPSYRPFGVEGAQ
jgi:hypothetical protein